MDPHVLPCLLVFWMFPVKTAIMDTHTSISSPRLPSQTIRYNCIDFQRHLCLHSEVALLQRWKMPCFLICIHCKPWQSQACCLLSISMAEQNKQEHDFWICFWDRHYHALKTQILKYISLLVLFTVLVTFAPSCNKLNKNLIKLANQNLFFFGSPHLGSSGLVSSPIG